MNNKDNLYKILGVSKNASNEDIKKSFRRLSLLNHPDKNDNNSEKVEKFKQISEAYEILSSSNKRKDYDNKINFTNEINKINDNNINNDINYFNDNKINNINDNKINDNKINDINDINDNINNNIISEINKLINFANNYSNLNNNPNIANRLCSGINLQNIYREKLHKDPLNIFFENDNIYNKKHIPNTIVVDVNISMKDSYTGIIYPLEIERSIIENNNKTTENEKIYINIPKGIDNNESITIEGKGNIINNIRGDVRIFIKINNNTDFERRGLDLVYKKSINIKECLYGYEFDIKYIDDRLFKIIDSKGSDSIVMNFEKVIPNLGIKRDNNIGNLIIEFSINNSEKFSKEQLDKLKELL